MQNNENTKLIHQVLDNFKRELQNRLDKIDDRLNTGNAAFATFKTEIAHLKEDIKKQDKKKEDLDTDMRALKATLEDRLHTLEITLAKGKPNWFIVSLIAMLVSVIGGLILYIGRG